MPNSPFCPFISATFSFFCQKSERGGRGEEELFFLVFLIVKFFFGGGFFSLWFFIFFYFWELKVRGFVWGDGGLGSLKGGKDGRGGKDGKGGVMRGDGFYPGRMGSHLREKRC